ncbi:putative Xaa-Pro aminopeptidase pepP [Metarhizium anisopliae]|nr:putative Xaa-Pro aminopeptidase pepP [Metarhizium anisopliae]
MAVEDFEAVLKAKYPGKAHAKRVVDLIRKTKPDANGVIYLEGRMTKLLEDNDSPEHFRQRRYFYYLTGCNLADCSFAYDIQSSKSILFIPPIDPDDVIWSGLPLSIDEALSRYDVDEVKFTTEVNSTLAHLAKQNPNSTIFAIANQVSDSVTFLEFGSKDFETVKKAIEVSRVVKDEFEVAMIRKANHISSLAHKAVIERSKAAATEQELYATFLERCVSHAAPEMAYHPILAAGKAAATLHYVDNNAPLKGKQNLLIDAGCEWNNYASDITRTFPLTGTFTKESRDIYDIVLRMQKECTELIKGGMLWDDLHLHAHKVAIDGLLALGILKGDAKEILNARTSAAFFPHGLGHHLGMDTHDTGGNPNPNDPDKLFRYLRLRGHVPAGAVVTVEPGIYFCDFIIKPYLDDHVHSKYIDAAVLNKYWDVGGVRIEDNIHVTVNGYVNLTTAIKEVSDVEAVSAK